MVAGATGGNGNSLIGSQAQGGTRRISDGGDKHSVAESAWPEELLQDLADLGECHRSWLMTTHGS